MNLQERIQIHLDDMSKIGVDPKGGWTRLTFTSEEQQMHDYAKSVLADNGYSIRTDAFGNLIASKQGKDSSRKKLMFGTHLDSVTNGGNFDGTVGFITAVEAVKDAEGIVGQLDYGVDIVIFRAEESTRFNRACIGSSAAFGLLDSKDMKKLVDKKGVTLEEAIVKNGGNPSQIGSGKFLLAPSDYFTYLETHIEQAGVLERDNVPLGIVTSIRAPERRKIEVIGSNSVKGVAEMVLALENHAENSFRAGKDIVGTIGKVEGYFGGTLNSINTVPGQAIFSLNMGEEPNKFMILFDKIAKRRSVQVAYNKLSSSYEITVTGRADHSGGTSMGLQYRKDALAAACEMIKKADKGIPAYDKITFYTDLRSDSVEIRDGIQTELSQTFYAIAEINGLHIVISEPTEKSEPQILDKELGQKLGNVANRLAIKTKYLPSGPGHDAMKASQAGIPTAMYFVPSRNGISHNPAEFTHISYIVVSTEALTQCLLDFNKEK